MTIGGDKYYTAEAENELTEWSEGDDTFFLTQKVMRYFKQYILHKCRKKSSFFPEESLVQNSFPLENTHQKI